MSHLKPPVSAKDHVQGSSSATIELVEYGDYECPHCGRAYPIIKNIQKTLGDKLRFVFRNFPLEESHPHAVHAALAAEAAAAQGTFWEMHDMIYENQHHLNDTSLVSYAKQLDLNLDQFGEDFEKPETQQKVENDFENGVRSGVNGTPTFFINGERYNGSWDEDTLLQTLQTM